MNLKKGIINTMEQYTKTSQTKSGSERKKLVKQLDHVIRDILKQGEDRCVCCGKSGLGWFHPKDNPYGLQVGHYVSRTVYALRWDLKNVHPQCSGCNYQHNNNPIPYTRFMLDHYGKEILDQLTFKRGQINKVSTPRLRELLEELQKL